MVERRLAELVGLGPSSRLQREITGEKCEMRGKYALRARKRSSLSTAIAFISSSVNLKIAPSQLAMAA